MLPLRDDNPSGTFPFITLLLIALNFLGFFYELSLQEPTLGTFIHEWGLVPARARFLYQNPLLNLKQLGLPFVGGMFLHGGWLHLLGNMWYLWIFGDNVEDRLGHFKFFGFYLIGGIIAGIIHVITQPASTIPCIGASGAVAAVLGAYFICYPGARVLTLVPIFVFITFIRIPAFFVLGGWFLLQVLTASSPETARTAAEASIAWWAHIGGFLAGMTLIILLPKSKRSRQKHYSAWHDRKRN